MKIGNQIYYDARELELIKIKYETLTNNYKQELELAYAGNRELVKMVQYLRAELEKK